MIHHPVRVDAEGVGQGVPQHVRQRLGGTVEQSTACSAQNTPTTIAGMASSSRRPGVTFGSVSGRARLMRAQPFPLDHGSSMVVDGTYHAAPAAGDAARGDRRQAVLMQTSRSIDSRA